ncbi:hypothetical protein D3C75_1348010 [compost metagenome]
MYMRLAIQVAYPQQSQACRCTLEGEIDHIQSSAQNSKLVLRILLRSEVQLTAVKG